MDKQFRALVERLRSPEFVVPETLVGKGVWLACDEIEKLLDGVDADVDNYIAHMGLRRAGEVIE